ncbi:baculoviral IAP repeat-containing protein 1 [Xenopus laevis]|uniref:Baculoviral IAP repeat-containing protein 1 n=2 Tax=Xenopus laevis TaxID=8355 RepID=A0A1L8I210_XENLA|nr:baculoviral IAP repeat-containing protein 1 [Xenopus laevis]XP_041424615.1 baculoviral IAP repeat-containing protein 1 [Xenopus laevis]OCU02365.1 hypothetical protein XELAEV_18008128mg [Xenopus laevis]
MDSMEPTEPGGQTMDVVNFNEYDSPNIVERVTKILPFLSVDVQQYLDELNEENEAIRQKVGKGYRFEMRSEARRLQSFLSFVKFSSWCPKAMASAGFYFTGVERSVQCFCCGIVFCTSSFRNQPLDDHMKRSPACGFLQGKDVGNIPKYEIRVQQPGGPQRDLQEYAAEESRLNSFKDWPFYARIQPDKLSAAGFFFTGIKDIVQCFSCTGCLGNWEENDDPWKEHAKWFPECNFLASIKTPDEIKQYILCYETFSGYTGKDFTTFHCENTFTSVAQERKLLNIFEDEKVRLESFNGWPENAHPEPKELARAGFFYKGLRDTVQCFFCAGCLKDWKDDDDPWKEHAKWYPECGYLNTCTNLDHIKIKDESQLQPVLHQEKTQTKTKRDVPTEDWFLEVTKLRHQLMDMYNNPQFTTLSSFDDSSSFSIDLKSLFADISVTAKDTKNQPFKQLTLPDILSDLVDITMIEGEAGSGKTALLRKIAILWASGTCPMLSRFILVFYISVPFIEKQQTLSQIISKHLTGSSTSLTEDILLNIKKQLKNQVLFLLDDYGTKDFIPEPIENLLQKNHWNRVSLAVTVRTDQGKKLRQYARTILSIQDFPLYSSMYIYRHLFSHDIPFLETFFSKMGLSEIFKAVLKTPMFTCALCVFWVRNQNRELSSDISVCKAYLMYTKLKHTRETERVEALVSLCGDLALGGVFKSQFDFTDEDLTAVGLSGDDSLSFGLLSKFTSQRLRPIYRFFYPTFQEFIASQRMDDLLQSENEIMKNKGLFYLQKINICLHVIGRYDFLKYCCMHTAKTTSIIISHLFMLTNNPEATESQTDTKVNLQHNPDAAFNEDVVAMLRNNDMKLYLSCIKKITLSFAFEVIAKGNFLFQCAPIILQFLKGQDITVDMFSPDMRFLLFLKLFPEGLSLLRSLCLSISNLKSKMSPVSNEELASIFSEVPTVEQDYSMAFKVTPENFGKLNLKKYMFQKLKDISDLDIDTSQHKIALLKIDVNGSISDLDTYLGNLLAFLSLADHIELRLSQSPGFIEAVWPCIDLYITSFVKCSFHGIELNMTEQDSILQMSSLESLQMTQMNPPEYLLSHLDRFNKLKELILDVLDRSEVVRFFPDGFKELKSLEKFVLSGVNLWNDSTKLAEFIPAFPNLTSLHLKCNQCPELERILEGLSRNENIQELNLEVMFPDENVLASMASVLPSIPNVKLFNIRTMYFKDMEKARLFVVALPCLVQLEELHLPGGPGISKVAETIMQQFQYLRNLRIILFPSNVLNDASLLQLAHAVRDGHLSNTEELDLSANHDITQSGWRDFFQLVDHLPKLNRLLVNRSYGREIKTDPLTFIALVQCVARLPSLRTLYMYSWLLDEKDIEMFNDMKKKHPQGKSLLLQWQWFLPFAAIVKD